MSSINTASTNTASTNTASSKPAPAALSTEGLPAALAPSDILQSGCRVDAWISADHIACLRLNAPDKLNALTVEMGQDFERAVAHLKSKSNVRAIVLTGIGRAFSAGGDLAFLLERANDSAHHNASQMRAFYQRFLSMRELDAPLIAAVNGAAIGAGMCLALAADIRVVSADAKLGVTFVGLGLHPGMGATHFLPKICGPERAARWLATGEIIRGEVAVQQGIASEAVPTADVLDRAAALALQISNAAPLAVQSVIGTLRRSNDADLHRALAREADAQAQSYATKDLREGIAALREKRAPKFEGA